MRAELNNINADIMELIRDLEGAPEAVSGVSEAAAEESAEIILTEQKRIFGKAFFKRDKAHHEYKMANAGLLEKMKSRSGLCRTKFSIGFSTKALRQYPELLIIEFDRPGKSPRHSGKTMTVKIHGKIIEKKKGEFPAAAQTMPVRVGFDLAKEQALKHYEDRMLSVAEDIFNGR